MKIVQIKFNSWDRAYSFDPAGFDLKRGDKVIVRTELGMDVGEVSGFGEADENGGKEIKQILRPADEDDLEKMATDEEKDDALRDCKRFVAKYNLPMKLVDANFSLDGSRVTFAFIANGRVDFRELVKELTRHFNRTVRLHQIGIRDEAKLYGDYGHCGQPLCCTRFLRDLASVTSDMAELQQVSHRGSERISGVCGRLMCCLGYEHNGYCQAAAKMPPVGSRVAAQGRKGRIVGWKALKQAVLVQLDAENGDEGGMAEFEIKEIKILK